MRFRFARTVALVVALAVTTTMALVSGGLASAEKGTTSERAGAAAPTVVAHNAKGKLRSKIVGTASRDRKVTGEFYPLDFSKKNGKVRVRGLLNGVVHNANGSTSTFSAMRTMRVKSIDGVPATNGRAAAQAAATCDVLNLVLAPLDLDLLGLQVHLDRVVLRIVAVSGAGNLLGNLLCAVTGLLDGGLGGQLGRLVRLLEDILGALRLGV